MVVHINPKFKYPREELEEKLSIKFDVQADYVVPARDLVKIEDLKHIDRTKLLSIVKNITLRDSDHKPYKNSEILVYRMSPSGMMIGQSFVLEDKILDLCRFSEFTNNFSIFGFSKFPPLLMSGKDYEGNNSCAIYLPPIAEVNSHHVLLDGMHRSYLCKSSDTSLNYLVIKDVDSPLPFKPMTWDHVNLVSERPPISERYVDLDMQYFRDLGSVGIDG